MEPAEAVLKFLRSVGPRKEAELYLRQFRSTPAERFALLVVDDATMNASADAVALDLRFLTQLGLYPVVLLGLHNPATARRHQQTLQTLLDNQAVVHTGPLACTDLDSIAEATGRGTLPLVTADPTHPPPTRWNALGDLLRALQTHKLIFLRPNGGLRLGGERLSLVDISSEFEELSQHPQLNEQDRELLQRAHHMLQQDVPHRLLIALTSPINLLHELFTVRGAGTLLRRGAHIERHTGLQGVDRTRLLQTLEASFERTPNASVLERPYTHCYLESHYRGGALLSPCPFGGYLSKFAVTRQAQGEGIGRDLWHAVVQDHPRMLWRARRHNPISAWYEQQCEGLYRLDEWTVYTRGIPAESLPAAISFALAQPRDFT